MPVVLQNYTSVPIIIPDLDDIRDAANKVHVKDKKWQGELFSWSAEYNPERAIVPLDSKMTFTPADFCIGESGVYFSQ